MDNISDLARRTHIALRGMLEFASPIEALILLPLMERATLLERDIRAFEIARIETKIAILEGKTS